MTETRSPFDQALDLLVYAPIGLALVAREELPKLIDRGRQQGTSQVALARMLGEMAVGKGQVEARRVFEHLVTRFANAGSDGASPTAAPAPPRAASRTGSATTRRSAPKSASRPSQAPGKSRKSVSAKAEDLAIPGYNALSAPQVVQRLSGLSAQELEAVGAYEAATRHRQTILGRITQLQSAGA